MQIMGDTLEAIFEMQKTFVSVIKKNRIPTTNEERIANLCTGIIHEAVELQRLTNWKWWKTPVKFDEGKAREELIDIWHFLVQYALFLKNK